MDTYMEKSKGMNMGNVVVVDFAGMDIVVLVIVVVVVVAAGIAVVVVK